MEEIKKAVNLRGVPADFTNVLYGSHKRNVFDIWLAKSSKPTPLVIIIHGGGFTGGDKSKFYDSDELVAYLDAGVSVALINYRFRTEAPFGILSCLNDSKRCLQYIRYKAHSYNINKTQIACQGGSAGAGTSLWLAFHNDMADPSNNDPVLRESTRLTCAGAYSTQATYELLKWNSILNVPVENNTEDQANIAKAIGLSSADEIYSDKGILIRKELDFLEQMDKNDVPFWVLNTEKGGMPENVDHLNHHPLHAVALKNKADKIGLEAVVNAPALGINDSSGISLVDFVLEKFELK